MKRKRTMQIVSLILMVAQVTTMVDGLEESIAMSCSDLLMGQYRCDFAEIDSETQAISNCIKNEDNTYTSSIKCYPAPGIECNGKVFDGETHGFDKKILCKPVSDRSFKTALLLSIFLGMFGIDRFYLGYPALGLLKLSTFGFMLVGQLVDIILIAAQVVKPADGGEYITDFYGPKLVEVMSNSSIPVL